MLRTTVSLLPVLAGVAFAPNAVAQPAPARTAPAATPVTRVTFDEAREYARLANLALPTEADWEALQPRVKIGVSIAELDEGLAAFLTMAPGAGLRITGVALGTPAAAADLRKNDVILAIDDVPVCHRDALRDALLGKGESDTVTLDLLRPPLAVPPTRLQVEVAVQVTPPRKVSQAYTTALGEYIDGLIVDASQQGDAAAAQELTGLSTLLRLQQAGYNRILDAALPARLNLPTLVIEQRDDSIRGVVVDDSGVPVADAMLSIVEDSGSTADGDRSRGTDLALDVDRSRSGGAADVGRAADDHRIDRIEDRLDRIEALLRTLVERGR